MIHHLFAEAALVVEDQRHAPGTADQRAQQRTFVQIGMDDVWPTGGKSARRNRQQRRQPCVQQQLTPRRADWHGSSARPERRTKGSKLVNVPPAGIGDYAYVVAACCQRAHLPANAYMTAIISEESGGCDGQDAQRTRGVLPHLTAHRGSRLRKSPVPTVDFPSVVDH